MPKFGDPAGLLRLFLWLAALGCVSILFGRLTGMVSSQAKSAL